MKITDLQPSVDEKQFFRLSSEKYIPQASGCYVLTTFENDILYIGLSENLQRRFHQHLNDSTKVSPTTDGKAFWFYYKFVDSIDIQLFERTWLNQYESIHGKLPIMNKVSSPVK